MKTTKVIAIVLLSNFIQILPVSSDVLEDWNKINSKIASDPRSTDEILKKIMEEETALAQLYDTIENHIKTTSTEKKIVNVVNTNDVSISDNKLREIVVDITRKFDKLIIDNIISETVNKLILTRKLAEMPDLLWSIYKKNEVERYDIMLRFQIQLYGSFTKRRHPDEKEFLQNYAYRLHKIKNEQLYISANMSLKSNLHSIENKLPENLKYLYFSPYFCLLNEKFKNYIYTAVERKLNEVSRYIWLWYDNQSMDDTGYIKANVLERNADNEKQFKVTLLGTKYQLYYYMITDTHIIAGWDTVGTPSNYIWDLEFVDDHRVVFSQNDYLMCGLEQYDNDRRNVGGRKKGEVSSTSPECQWRLGECLFR